MICYAVIDTNVIVSAFITKNKDAATVKVLNLILSQQIKPLFSKQIMDEYHEVLSRSKFNIPQEDIKYFFDRVISFGEMIEPAPSGEILPDMKDLPFFEVVLEKKDDGAYLVTGNTKHFPKKPFVVTCHEFLQILGVE